jgi:predicted transcriptional regulator of viral defense system
MRSARACARGRLHRLYRGVYSVGHTALTRRGRKLAAVLACCDGAALSHRSAGFAWGVVRSATRDIQVTCGRSRPPGPHVVVHRSPLGPGDPVVLDGIPVTTVARTLVDLAGGLVAAQLSAVLAARSPC